MKPINEHARGCLVGLAVGDALGSPAEGKTPEQIRERWGRITDFLSDEQGGTDDTEYALFSAKLLFSYGLELSPEKIVDAYRAEIISGDNAYKGAGFSEILSIRNLQSGLQPPFSGQHLHSWSDGLAMRVAPYGIVAAGKPALAAQLAGIDGCVSHAGEGIFSGQAVAAAIATAITGAAVTDIVAAALAVIPENSWTFRSIDRAVRIGWQSPDVWASIPPLYAAIVCHHYYWADIAPEAVGLAFGLLVAASGNFTESVLGGINIGRDTDTIAAIAGAITGARSGFAEIPERWRERIRSANGTCIKTVRGMDLMETADKLATLASEWSAS